MTISESDISFKKSVNVTDTSANGGRKGQVPVISGARHGLFPRVSKTERTNGVTRYRKEFLCNANADDDVAYDVMLFLEFPSNGGDRFAIGKGTQTDTQADLTTNVPIWNGVGSLFEALAGGETSVRLTMENTDFAFENGGYLHLSNKFMVSQTVAADVSIGNSVRNVSGSWVKATATSNINYPYGLYVGSNKVMTVQDSTNEEWLTLANNLYEGEVIGTGDGANATIELSTLTNVTNGIYKQTGGLPVVTATIGGIEKTVNVAADGSCSGFCVSGTLNMANGVWTADIVWNAAPDAGTSITITYKENCFSYSGNVVTVELDEQIANTYAVNNSYGAGCVHESELTTTSSSFTKNTTNGTYDEELIPPILYNDGTEQDTWTITFASSTSFTCSGVGEGSVGSGVITSDFSPTNPNTGQPYFTIDKDGWGGSWEAGDTIQFTTSPSGLPVWWREIVPSGIDAEPNNVAIIGWYLE